jgi:hypothetical protein
VTVSRCSWCFNCISLGKANLVAVRLCGWQYTRVPCFHVHTGLWVLKLSVARALWVSGCQDPATQVELPRDWCSNRLDNSPICSGRCTFSITWKSRSVVYSAPLKQGNWGDVLIQKNIGKCSYQKIQWAGNQRGEEDEGGGSWVRGQPGLQKKKRFNEQGMSKRTHIDRIRWTMRVSHLIYLFIQEIFGKPHEQID